MENEIRKNKLNICAPYINVRILKVIKKIWYVSHHVVLQSLKISVLYKKIL